jgi:gamma-glutamylcysteine synthetase
MPIGDDLYSYYSSRFSSALADRDQHERRIGVELKFALVDSDGAAAPRDALPRLWHALHAHGWRPRLDSATNDLIGATTPGELNDTVASFETGYCKPEFSLAHVGALADLEQELDSLRTLLRGVSAQEEMVFLAYGIQPVTPPGRHLLANTSRAGVFDRLLVSNNHIPPERGHDLHLFTVNSASHVHVSVHADEAVDAVNVLNGFAPAQIFLTAHSPVWQGACDPTYDCVAEKFWDWWMPEQDRVGVPPSRFADLRDYVDTITGLHPILVTRDGVPLAVAHYESLQAYCAADNAYGVDADGQHVPLTPRVEDLDVHSTCYWYNARLTRYFTVENRANDQQPPEEMILIAALTLGLVAALPDAVATLDRYDWDKIRSLRDAACRRLRTDAEQRLLARLAGEMLSVARKGLHRRDRDEEHYLEPLTQRLADRVRPADDAIAAFNRDGAAGLIAGRAL